jgi:uncharacterized protein (TIGR00369 family)
MQRTRTVTWEDPLAAAARGRELDGMGHLRAMVDGDVPPPPIAVLLGFEPVELEEGRVVFGGDPGEHLYNPIGVVHAGWAMTLLDSAMGCAVHSTLPAGTGYTTLETKVNLVRPITLDTGPVRCEGTVVHRGGRVATAEGRVTAQGSGKLLAHGTSTCLLLAG